MAWKSEIRFKWSESMKGGNVWFVLISLYLGVFRWNPLCVAQEWILQSPKDYQVIQRTHSKGGTLMINGVVHWAESSRGVLQSRVHGDSNDPWTSLGEVISGEAFSFKSSLPSGGWYRLDLSILSDDKLVAEHSVAHVGMGEVFVVAGQSNSANHGEARQKTETGMVTVFDGSEWHLSEDPQPGASGRGGSFLPPLGDLLTMELKVPIGFISCGIGATSVREWMPEGFQFSNPPTLTGRVKKLPDGQWASDGRAYSKFMDRIRVMGKHGFRAVLWHQGESDANQRDPTRTLPGHLYRDYLGKLIQSSRQEIGWTVPWFVAQVSYHVPGDEASPDIRAAQASLWKNGIALQGPDSDAIKGHFRERNGQGVHFSASGLKEHARRWADKMLPWIEQLE